MFGSAKFGARPELVYQSASVKEIPNLLVCVVHGYESWTRIWRKPGSTKSRSESSALSPSPVTPSTILHSPLQAFSSRTQKHRVRFTPCDKSLPFRICPQLLPTSLVFKEYTIVASSGKKSGRKGRLLHLIRELEYGVRGMSGRDGDGKELRSLVLVVEVGPCSSRGHCSTPPPNFHRHPSFRRYGHAYRCIQPPQKTGQPWRKWRAVLGWNGEVLVVWGKCHFWGYREMDWIA